MTEWKDATSYSRSETKGADPRTWEVQLGEAKLIVTRFHGLEGWWMLCYKYGIREHQDLREFHLENAQQVALRRFQQLAQNAIIDANNALQAADTLIQ